MKKLIAVILLLLLISMFAFGCNDEVIPDATVEIDTPLEVFNYFYDSLAAALSGDTAEVSYQLTTPGEESEAPISLFKKSGGVVFSNKDDNNKAYFNGRAYYNNAYSKYADMSLKNYLALVFNDVYEVELEYFIFSDLIEFESLSDGYKLTAESYGYPHKYTIELLTDLEHKFKSAHIVSQAYTFIREIDMVVTYPAAVTGVPLSTALPLVGTDMTDTWRNLSEISASLYIYSQNTTMQQNVYKAVGSENYGLPQEKFTINGNSALFTNDNGYSCYMNGKLYTEDLTLTPDYNKKTYIECKVGSVKYLAMRNIFWIVNDFTQPVITKTVVDNTITYSSAVFDCIIKDNVIDSVIDKEYNSSTEQWTYEKHQFVSTIEAIMIPSTLVYDQFISDYRVGDLSSAASALMTCRNVFDNHLTYQGYDLEDHWDYLVALDTLSAGVVDSAPALIDMVSHYFYIEERHSTIDLRGEVTAIYYSGNAGIYKVYLDGDGNIVYDLLS